MPAPYNNVTMVGLLATRPPTIHKSPWPFWLSTHVTETLAPSPYFELWFKPISKSTNLNESRKENVSLNSNRQLLKNPLRLKENKNGNIPKLW